MKASELEHRLRRSSSQEEDAALIKLLEGEANRADILEQLSNAKDPEVRGWVPEAASAILGRDAIPLIRRMSDDPDHDVRSIAIDSLAKLDAEALAGLIPRLRRDLGSTDPFVGLASAWRLARLGDTDSVQEVREFRDSVESGTGLQRGADIALAVLTDPASISRRILSHDHDHMPWLAQAAAELGRPDGKAALASVVANPPDEACGQACREQWSALSAP